MSGGVPAGAVNITQLADSIGGPPDSGSVGTLGAAGRRLEANMPSAFTFPESTCCIMELGNIDEDLHVSCDEVCHRRCSALVGNMHHLDIGRMREQFGSEVRSRTHAGRCK